MLVAGLLLYLLTVANGEIETSTIHDLHSSNDIKSRSMRRGVKLWDWNQFTESEIKTNKIKTLLLVFYDKVNEEESKSALSALETIATEFTKNNILHVSVEREKLHTFQFFLKDEEDSDFPFAVIVEINQGFRKYRLSEAVTEASLRQFEEMYFSNKLSPWLRSEEATELSEEMSVTPLVGSQFQSQVKHKYINLYCEISYT
eukprot:GHVL01021339.1.p1 GENE.GHVL01021339.1~~GHVL01021339.1.p1  ORF type:complete len:202 (+),score=32.06 GHVL01021339.1:35-640(+)